MGNYVSCTLSPSPRHSRPARVILPSGEVRHFRHLCPAAEIMLESPGCFVSSSRSLRPGRRFSALGADQGLQAGGLYVAFPMRRLGTVVTAADVALMFVAGQKRLAGGRVAPDGGDAPAQGSDGGDGEGFPARCSAAAMMYRSKKPALETIREEGVIRWR